jgi:uncharacterized protein with NRDE domain
VRNGNSFDGFNLLYGTTRELHYFTNRGGSSGVIKPGVHGLSNHLLDTDWPKVLVARERMSLILQQPEISANELLISLADPEPFAGSLLPDTGIGPERERLLSPLFIKGDEYATRSTTVILADFSGELTFIEQIHDGPDLTPQQFTLQLQI